MSGRSIKQCKWSELLTVEEAAIAYAYCPYDNGYCDDCGTNRGRMQRRGDRWLCKACRTGVVKRADIDPSEIKYRSRLALRRKLAGDHVEHFKNEDSRDELLRGQIQEYLFSQRHRGGVHELDIDGIGYHNMPWQAVPRPSIFDPNERKPSMTWAELQNSAKRLNRSVWWRVDAAIQLRISELTRENAK